jgi:hypothetical protein
MKATTTGCHFLHSKEYIRHTKTAKAPGITIDFFVPTPWAYIVSIDLNPIPWLNEAIY